MIQYLAVSALGTDEIGVAHHISEIVAYHQCQTELTCMNKMASEFAINLLVSGNRNNIIKLEAALNELANEENLAIATKLAEDDAEENSTIPYIVQIITPYNASLLEQVTHFFAENEINIREMTGCRYVAQQTGLEMFNLQLIIDLSMDAKIAQFREEFSSFCEQINIDASLEPDKL
ncbi:MAG: ACT domain-containing protein [Pseudomonadota bacterium]